MNTVPEVGGDGARLPEASTAVSRSVQGAATVHFPHVVWGRKDIFSLTLHNTQQGLIYKYPPYASTGASGAAFFLLYMFGSVFVV